MKSIQVDIDLSISTEDVVRGRYTSLCRYTTYIDGKERLYFLYYYLIILLSFDLFNAHHIFFYIINCHAKHETEDLQMEIHPGLGVLATGN